MADNTAKRSNDIALWALVVSVISLLLSIQAVFDPFGLKEGKLTEPTPLPPVPRFDSPPIFNDPPDANQAKFRPNGNNTYTVLSVPNRGEYELTIQRIDFQAEVPAINTPVRQELIGAAEPLYVEFSNFNPRTGFASFTPRLPHSVPGHQEVPIGVVIVNRELNGRTYTGTLTIHYSNGGKLEITGVEIDALSTAPKR